MNGTSVEKREGRTGTQGAMMTGGAHRKTWRFQRMLIVTGCVLAILSPLSFMNLEVYTFVGPMMIPTVVALVIILASDRPWAYLTSGIVGSLFSAFIFVGFGIFGGSLDPLKASEFNASLINLLALLLILPGGISGFANTRAKRIMPVIGAGWRTRLGTFAVAASFLVLGAIGAGTYAATRVATGGTSGYDFVPQASIGLVTEAFAFAPQTLSVTAGTITEIAVENKDTEFHTFTYVSGGNEYSHDLFARGKAKFLVLFETAGEVKYWCKPHSNGATDDGSGMVGTLQVVAAS